MIMEKPGLLADCWINGEPSIEGLVLVRVDNCGNAWYWLVECKFCTHRPNRMVYYNNVGGNYASRAFNGTVTHHCKATAKNFGLILEVLVECTYNFDKLKYEVVNKGS